MEEASRRMELFLGLMLAVFAAILAINDLGAGKYGDDEMIAHNKQTEAYNWYQSKSIKQSLVEGQRDMVKALLQAHAIQKNDIDALDSFLLDAESDIARYKKEKQEILKGSASVGKENWVQEREGKMGQIVGAEEWQQKAEKLGEAGDVYDLATLFLQLSLVLGAIGLVLQSMPTRKVFAMAMFAVGALGSYFAAKAYLLAMAVS